MKRYVYLFKNMGLLTISSFGSKLLSFFLIPLYTSILSTKEYGIYDFFSTTILLLIPILTAGIIESVLRFPLTDRKNKLQIYTIGMQLLLKGFVILVLAWFVNYIFSFSLIFKQYGLYFLLMYFTTAVSQLLQSYARGIDKFSALAISGVISTTIIVSLNIYFLVYLRMALAGYFLANIIGMILTILYLLVALNLLNVNILKSVHNVELKKQMLSYSKPTIANSIGWWVNSASDRYIVISMFGLAVNGIYSVGYKIPSIMTAFQNIFSQAWSVSAVDEFDPNDEHSFYSNIYKMTNFSMVLICSLLIMFTKLIASFLYQKQFYSAWRYVPFLLISVLFGSLIGVLGGVFIAVKDSKELASSTMIGAAVNVITGIALAFVIGPLGTALGTTISYVVVWIIRIFDVKKYMRISIRIYRDSISYILLLVQSICLLAIKPSIINYSIQIIFVLSLLIINNEEIRFIIKAFNGKTFKQGK